MGCDTTQFGRGKGEDGASCLYLNGGRMVVLSSDGDYCKE